MFKVIPFKLPNTASEAFRVQVDVMPHFYDQLHQHNELQIMLIVKSEGTLVAGDYINRFNPGDLYIIGGGQAHVFRNDEKYYRTSTREKAHAISIYFDFKYLGETFWSTTEVKTIVDFINRANGGFKIYGQSKHAVSDHLREIVHQEGFEKIITYFNILKILSESNECTPLTESTITSSLTSREEKRMNDIFEFTFRESGRKIYLQEVASIANLTPEAFCRYFKQRTRKPYTRFLNEVRISKACKILIEKRATVQEVSYETGFQNLSHFNRVFKKITGKSPTNYIKPVSTL